MWELLCRSVVIFTLFAYCNNFDVEYTHGHRGGDHSRALLNIDELFGFQRNGLMCQFKYQNQMFVERKGSEVELRTLD